MKRVGFKMKLKPGYAGTYKKRHQEIWPELKELLREAGIQDYGIWLDTETNILFATQSLPDDFDEAKLSEAPLMKKWWKHMADIMDTEEDFSPVTVELEEMFFMA
jgi:L-rhamnose mutarotase